MVLSDGGGELVRGIEMLRSQHPAASRVCDVKHELALFLKKELEQDDRWKEFIAAVTRPGPGITQTALAVHIPPALKSKARSRNRDTPIRWARGVLGYLKKPRGHPQAPADLSKLDEKPG